MKSIMEEASSIAKAVEKGWIKAGQPKEFSVKIFEHPQKNFIGMTTKPAKIAIIFDERPEAPRQKPQYTEESSKRVARVHPRQEQPARPARQKSQDAPVVEQPIKPQPSEGWNSAMTDVVEAWLKKTLKIMGKEGVEFTMQKERTMLKINFNQPLLPDQTQQETLLKIFAQLLLQVVRHELHRSMRGYRIYFNIA